MNPDSTDLENRGRTAQILRESKNDRELVWKNIIRRAEPLGRSRRWGAQKFSQGRQSALDSGKSQSVTVRATK